MVDLPKHAWSIWRDIDGRPTDRLVRRPGRSSGRTTRSRRRPLTRQLEEVALPSSPRRGRLDMRVGHIARVHTERKVAQKGPRLTPCLATAARRSDCSSRNATFAVAGPGSRCGYGCAARSSLPGADRLLRLIHVVGASRRTKAIVGDWVKDTTHAGLVRRGRRPARRRSDSAMKSRATATSRRRCSGTRRQPVAGEQTIQPDGRMCMPQ